MRIQASCMFMAVLFPCVKVYDESRVTELKEGIEDFYALFPKLDNNPIFGLVMPSLEGFQDPKSFKEDRKNANRSSFQTTNKKCERMELFPGLDLSYSSSCPWYREVNSDNRRIPKDIIVAKCRCSACKEGCCKPVTIDLPVLRWYGGKYVPTIEPLSVACVCQYMTGIERHNNCGKGKMFEPIYSEKKKHTPQHGISNGYRTHKTQKGKLNTHNKPKIRKIKRNTCRKHKQQKFQRKRRKIRRKNVTIVHKRQLIWWRYKNCSYYRYCKL